MASVFFVNRCYFLHSRLFYSANKFKKEPTAVENSGRKNKIAVVENLLKYPSDDVNDLLTSFFFLFLDGSGVPEIISSTSSSGNKDGWGSGVGSLSTSFSSGGN